MIYTTISESHNCLINFVFNFLLYMLDELRDVKRAKKFIEENFVIFYCDVKTYLHLCSSSTQREISHLSNKWADLCSNTKM